MSKFPHTQENRNKMLLVASSLQGSSMSLEEGLSGQFGDGDEEPDVSDFAIELLALLDDQVMMCEDCNWWCETGELNDDQVCIDCEENH